ncbi:MAG: replicative DNA helicase [Deltaproteobacteria bacterium]|nr:replicative DNA helicase [Deltaproteobacteria bacterium]MBI3079162.1 replicative DNA helicase [Deltaproteobacteria bacterium]
MARKRPVESLDPLRVPPHSLEAERSVLGGILVENRALDEVLEALGDSPDEPAAENFYREGHRKIFRAMMELHERGEPIDQITLTEVLRAQKALEEVGGAFYLASLIDAVPTAANVVTYARIVREKAYVRRVLEAALGIAARGYEGPEDGDRYGDEAQQAVFAATQRKIWRSVYPINAVLKETFDRITRLYEAPDHITGVPTGFIDIDKMTSGLQPSDVIIVAGRPGMGKTSFCLDVAVHAAKRGVTTAIFSLEMSKEQLAMRMLCSEARIDAHKLRTGLLSQGDWSKLSHAAGPLSEAPMFIDDTAAMSVMELRAKARRLKVERSLGLIVIDYLQLMRGPSDVESRQIEISFISGSLKALAKELAVPVVAVSQLSRRVEERDDQRPRLADLRESGSLEQDADLVGFIYRDEVYRKESPDKGIAEFIIGKQRNGPTGTVKLKWFDKYTTFETLAERDERP